MPSRSTATSGSLDGSHGYDPAASAADVPGSGGVAHRTPVDLPSGGPAGALVAAVPAGLVLFTLALIAAWLVVDPRTPDLAAQVYRVGLFHQQGFALWDNNWYAGHDLLGYSLLYPPLASLVGMRLLGALCVLQSTLLFERLARLAFGEVARWGAAWFALAALGDVWSGQMTFALGVSMALAAALALAYERWLWAALLAALCAAASPVAGALLGLAGLTLTLWRRSPRVLAVLAGPAAVVVLVLVALFPEGGYEPYPILSFAATMLVVLTFLWALPARARLLQLGASVYVLACVGCLLVHSPMGSNVERYAMLAGPLLACAVLDAGDGRRHSGDGRDRSSGGGRPLSAWRSAACWRWRVGPVAALALCVSAVWVVWGPVRETEAVAGSEATSAPYYAPVKHFLAEQHGGPVRVEVPLTRSHWEAAELAPTVSLARGWDKQLETRFNDVLLRPGLSATSYDRWLHEQAVTYVALPDVKLDPSSAQEGRLIDGGVPYLRQVFSSAHWRIFRVLEPTPLASGPGTLTSLSHASFVLFARARGTFLVRVHFTRYWAITSGSGCVAPAPGGWTAVRVRSPGTAVVSASFSLGRAFSSGGSCAGG